MAPGPTRKAAALGNRAKRLALFILGWVFVALGVVGMVLPVLPTTPFLLIALWAFANSSERFHGWLYHHRIFGPTLQRWERHRVIPPAAKVAALTAMAVSMLYVIGFSGAPVLAQGAMAAVCSGGVWFILTRPSRPPDSDNA